MSENVKRLPRCEAGPHFSQMTKRIGIETETGSQDHQLLEALCN